MSVKGFQVDMSISELNDFDLGAGSPPIADGDILVWNDTTQSFDYEAQSGGGGASQLSDLSDVNTSTATNRNVLVADGVDFESRALVEADISDLGTYITSADVTYGNLNTNGDVGTTAGTLAIGNHNHTGIYALIAGSTGQNFAAADMNVQSELFTRQVTEKANFYTQASGAVTLTASFGTYFYPTNTATGILTFTFSAAAAAGLVTSFTLELLNAGSFVHVWPASVKWPGGTVPTFTTGIDIVSFSTRDAGTTWFGYFAGGAFA